MYGHRKAPGCLDTKTQYMNHRTRTAKQRRSSQFAWFQSFFRLEGGAGIRIQNLPEVVRLAECCSPASEDQVVQEQLASILVVPPEIVGGLPWNVVAEQPGARVVVLVNAVERVEIRGLAIIGDWYERTADPRRSDAVPTPTERGYLDARKIGLERHSIVVLP